MPVSNFFVSVIAPLSNDEDIIESFFNETTAVLESNYQHYELILVDDGSSDRTRSIIEKLLAQKQCVRYIRLSRSFSLEVAISCGLEVAIGDVVVMLEPIWDPPNLIPELVEKVRQINGVVFGVKKNAQGKYLNYRLGRKMFDWVSDMLLKFPPPKNVSYFIGLPRQAVNAIIQIKDDARFIQIFSAYIGFPKQIFEYTPKVRKKYPYRNLFESLDYAIAIIVNNTTVPLKLFAYTGLLASFLNTLFIAYVFLSNVFRGHVAEGGIIYSFQSSLMFFFVFIALVVISEYLEKLILEVKARPFYFIEEEKNSCVMFSEHTKKNVVRDAD